MRTPVLSIAWATLAVACDPTTPAGAPLFDTTSSIDGFSFLVPGVLAGMPLPSAQDAVALEDSGIMHVVSLTETVPAVLEGFDVLHLPVHDFQPPTQRQQEDFVAAVDQWRAAGDPVVVHCTAGLGRTGTMLATWLVFEGMPAEQAIHNVRQLRPGSIETAGQEAQIIEYEASLSGAPW